MVPLHHSTTAPWWWKEWGPDAALYLAHPCNIWALCYGMVYYGIAGSPVPGCHTGRHAVSRHNADTPRWRHTGGAAAGGGGGGMLW